MQLILLQPTNSRKCRDGKYVKNGSFILAGLFSIENCERSDISLLSILKMEAMVYAIEQVNLQFKNNLFGFVIYDASIGSDFDLISHSILDLVYSIKDFPPIIRPTLCKCLNKENFMLKTLGLIGPGETASAVYLQKVTSFIPNLPIISYSATSAKLSEKSSYPKFFRTVPPDVFQVKAFTDFILKFKWTYVSILVSDNDYGRDGMEELKISFSKNNICIGVEAVLKEAYNQKEYGDVISYLNNSHTKVVVFWGSISSLKSLWEDVKNRGLHNLTWIISDANQMNSWFMDFKESFNGTIVLVVPTLGVDENFRDYFLNLTYKDANPWVKRMFENFDKVESDIQDNLKVRDLNYKFDFTLAKFVQIAVSVYVNAFFKYQEHYCASGGCEPTYIINRERFFNRIKDVDISMNQNMSFYFDQNQDPQIAVYEFSFVTSTKFILIANWSSVEKLRLINDSLNTYLTFASTCSEPCPPGKYAVYNQQKPCCWICQQCSEGHVKADIGQHECIKCPYEQYPDPEQALCNKLTRVYVRILDKNKLTYAMIGVCFSILGATASGVVLLTFIIKRNTPVVRSTNIPLSLVQITGHFLLFVLPLLFIGEDNFWKCATRTYADGVIFFAMISLIFVKIHSLVAMFGAFRKLTKKDKLQMRLKEMTVFFCTILIYAVMIFVIHVIYPLSVTEHIDTTALNIYKHCDSEPFSIADLCCMVLILVMCIFQLIRGRKLPGKFNDAKLISFAMFTSIILKLIPIPMGFYLRDPYSRTLMLWVVSNASNFLLLAILYFPKIKVIWFQPKKNSVQVFRKVCFLKIQKSITRKSSVAPPNSTVSASYVNNFASIAES